MFEFKKCKIKEFLGLVQQLLDDTALFNNGSTYVWLSTTALCPSENKLSLSSPTKEELDGSLILRENPQIREAFVDLCLHYSSIIQTLVRRNYQSDRDYRSFEVYIENDYSVKIYYYGDKYPTALPGEVE